MNTDTTGRWIHIPIARGPECIWKTWSEFIMGMDDDKPLLVIRWIVERHDEPHTEGNLRARLLVIDERNVISMHSIVTVTSGDLKKVDTYLRVAWENVGENWRPFSEGVKSHEVKTKKRRKTKS